MKNLKSGSVAVLGLWLAAVLFSEVNTFAEETFPLLQIGTHTYTNVTVTTKSKAYVFILHSQGMTNLKVNELPPEALKALGYADPAAPKTNATTAWAKQTIAKLDVPQLKNVETQFKEKWSHSAMAAKLSADLPEITPTLVATVVGVILLLYLFYCFCCMLICKKAGHEPGVLVWLPILQLFPLLKAARMSGWWFLGFLIPGLNLLGQLIWCFKIADARGKTAWVGLFLILPITSVLAFLYLAFSDRQASEREDKRIEIMTLETA